MNSKSGWCQTSLSSFPAAGTTPNQARNGKNGVPGPPPEPGRGIRAAGGPGEKGRDERGPSEGREWSISSRTKTPTGSPLVPSTNSAASPSLWPQSLAVPRVPLPRFAGRALRVSRREARWRATSIRQRSKQREKHVTNRARLPTPAGLVVTAPGRTRRGAPFLRDGGERGEKVGGPSRGGCRQPGRPDRFNA